MSSPYNRRLALNSRAIRILTLLPGQWSSSICCLLNEAALDDNITYEAISYAWGNQNDRTTIILENVKTEIPSSLETALRHLRHSTKALQLWADAVCINQQDLDEKAHQISMMSDIFRRCKSTYIWLGTPSTSCPLPCYEKHELMENCEEVARHQVDPFSLIHHFARDGHLYNLSCFVDHGPDEGMSFLVDPGFKTTWEAFTDSLQKSWWSRFWCVQECLLPNTAQVVLGHWRVPWETIKLCEINYKRHVLGCCSNAAGLMPQKYTFYPDLVVVSTRLDANRSTKPLYVSGDLDQLMRSFGYKACQDPRDKIYGIWGLIDQSRYPGITIDYSKSVGSVYLNVTESLLLDAAGDLRCLTGLGFNSQLHNLPSWVRNFDLRPSIAVVSYELMKFQSYKLFDAARGMKAAPNIIRDSLLLQGVFVDKIHRVGEAIQQRSWDHVWDVLRGWLALVGLDNLNRIQKEHFDQKREHAFCHTIVGGVVFDGQEQARRINDGDMDSLTTWLSKMLQSVTQGYEPSMSSWVRTFFPATYGRALFCTERGHLGLCYPSTQPGDDLWILYGSNVPFVLRQSLDFRQRSTEPLLYSLVGDAYFHLFMDGEALMKPNFKVQQLILR